MKLPLVTVLTLVYNGMPFLKESIYSILEQDYNLVFFMGLNLIDGLALTLTLLIQFFIFSKGISLNRSFIKFSAMFV